MDKHNQWKQHLRKLQSLFSIIIVLGITSFQSIANKSIKSSEQIINGIIKDEKGEALPGVNVIIKGTQKGVSSNQDGKYSITVNQKDATLIYSFVGYISQEVKISNQTIINITLQPAAKSLDEVVVIGYGTQKASDITGSVASFDAKHLEEKPISRIEQALVGQMAGVQVKQQSGLPGAGLSVVVRGTGSINAGSEPLYVIDGFPLDVAGQSSDGSIGTSPLANLSANDIESIQVLKDAAAGAIYGSRAANGVVLITTKKGKSGKLKINLNANSGISSIAKKLDILSADEWVNVATEVANINWVRSGTGRTADQTNDQRRAILGLKAGEYNTSYMPDERWSIAGHPGLQYVDWQDAIYRKASFQNYQLSATGGTENVSYFFSGNYLNQQSTLIGTDY